jgi:hypothetical protein
MQPVLDIVKANCSHLHEGKPDHPKAAAAESLRAQPSAAQQRTSSGHFEEAVVTALLPAIQRLAADVNMIKLAVATDESTTAGQPGPLLPATSWLATNAAVGAAAQHRAIPTASATLMSAAHGAKSTQRMARQRSRAVAQGIDGPTQPSTLLTHVHDMYSGQNFQKQAIGVPPAEPPSSSGKPNRISATVLAVRAASSSLANGDVSFPTTPSAANGRAIRQGRTRTPPTTQRDRSITPNSHSGGVWDSVVLVSGGRPPLPFSSSVQHPSGASSVQPMHCQSNPQMARSTSWAVALAAAVDNDSDLMSTAPAAAW